MTRTGASARLAGHLPEPFVDLHHDDAAGARLADGDLARVETRWGSAVLRVRTSGEVAPGSLFVPMHWSAANSSAGRAGALVNPAVDPASGEPEFKHTPARIERFDTAWKGVLLSRTKPVGIQASWWTLVQGDGYVRVEMAGDDRDLGWLGAQRLALGVDGPAIGLMEFVDEAAGTWRAAVVRDDQLEACAFVTRGTTLPSREWLAGLFAKEALGEGDRLALLAGRPLHSIDADQGPLVCSCFGVRRAAIAAAIEKDGLETSAEVGACLKAGTNCGSCLPEIRALLAAATRRAAAA
jgi:assimilatory nitrate reductase catalytic subunit